MSIRNRTRGLMLLLAVSCVSFGQNDGTKIGRDSQSLDILKRVMHAAGGLQSVTAIHDITEQGEITFYWGEGVSGPVTIRTLGGMHFRMEADLPDGKQIWLVRNAIGSRIENEITSPMSQVSAVNLPNLTYPLAYVAVALADPTTEVSFAGIEKREGRSLYRLRVKGQLGTLNQPTKGLSIVKDLLVDALSFDIVGVEDRPVPARAKVKGPSAISRAIEFGDFRTVTGVRMPYLISTELWGQKSFIIRMSEVTFNTNPSDQEFDH